MVAKRLRVARIEYDEYMRYLSLVKEAGIIPCKAISNRPHPIEPTPENNLKEHGQSNMCTEGAFSTV